MVLLVNEETTGVNKRANHVAPSIERSVERKESDWIYDGQNGTSTTQNKVPDVSSKLDGTGDGYSHSNGNGQSVVNRPLNHSSIRSTSHGFKDRFKGGGPALKASPSNEILVAHPSKGYDSDRLYASMHGANPHEGSKMNTRPPTREGNLATSHAF